MYKRQELLLSTTIPLNEAADTAVAARVISRVRTCLPILITSFPLVFRRKGGQVLLRENVTRVMMEFHVCDVCVTRGCREDSVAFADALARQR